MKGSFTQGLWGDGRECAIMFSQLLTCCHAFIFTILTLSLILLFRFFSCLYMLVMHATPSLLYSNFLVLNFPNFNMMRIMVQKKKTFQFRKADFYFNYHFQMLIQNFIFKSILQTRILAVLYICLWKICHIRKVPFCEGGCSLFFSWHYNFYGNVILIHLIQILLFNNVWNSW